MKRKTWFKWTVLLGLMSLIFAGCQETSEGSPAPLPTPQTESAAPQEEKQGEKDEDTIVILHTNDVHCGLNDKIGYDGLSLYKKEMEQKYENVLLLDAGDAIQGDIYGTLSKGDIIIDLMNDVGYDAATLGNHEFDYGFEVLDNLSEKLKCGYICANFATADGELVFEPYRIFEAAGKKIAVIGIVTPSTFTKSKIGSLTDDQGLPMYDFMADETGERLVNCVQHYADEVKEKGADVVILMSHLGNGDGEDLRYHSEEIIRKTNGIDIVIDGHEHAKTSFDWKNKDKDPVLVQQTGTKLQSIGKILIHPDSTFTAELVEEVPEPNGIEAELAARGKKEYWVDSSVKKKIGEYCSAYEDLLNRKIGDISFDLPLKNSEGTVLSKIEETGIVNLLTDAMLEEGDSEIALYNGGGARNGLAKGEITWGDIVSAFPYANDVIVVKLKGEDLLHALEFGARRLPLENNGLLHGSGLVYTIDLSVASQVQEDANGVYLDVKEPFRVKDVLINGKPLDPEREYTVTMNTYLQGGGDGMAMMKNAEILRYTQKVDYEILSDYIERVLNGEIPQKYEKPEDRLRIIGQ